MKKLRPLLVVLAIALPAFVSCGNIENWVFDRPGPGASPTPSAPIIATPTIILPADGTTGQSVSKLLLRSSSFISEYSGRAPQTTASTRLFLSFEDEATTEITDGSGSQAPGQAGGGMALISDGRFGQAIRGNGFTSSLVRFPDNDNLRIPGPLTVEAWVRPLPQSSHDGRKSVVSKYSSTLPGQTDQRSYDLGLFDLKPYFYISRNGLTGSGNEARVQSDVALPLGAWSKLRATFDGQTVNIFINGKLESSVDVSSELGSQTIHAGTADLLVGAVNGGINFENFAGDIDEVLIAAEVLSEDTSLPSVPHLATDWRILSESGDTVWESLQDQSHLYQISLTEGSFVGALSSHDSLKPETTYSAQVRYLDVEGNLSEWSTPIFFTTGAASDTTIEYEEVIPNSFDISLIANELGPITRIKFTPDGQFLLVSYLYGPIDIFTRNGSEWVKQEIPFFDLGDLGTTGERGITGLFLGAEFDAASPDLERRDVFVAYQAFNGTTFKNRITRVTFQQQGELYVGTNGTLIYESPQSTGSAHQIQDGIGFLYEGASHFLVSVGDGFAPEEALDPTVEGNGKLLLMQRDGSDPLGARPFPSGASKVQAIGVRNAYGIAMAPETIDPRQRILGVENGNGTDDRIWFVEAVDFGHEVDGQVSLGYTGADNDPTWTTVEDVNTPGPTKNEAVLSLLGIVSPTSVAYHPGAGVIPPSSPSQASFIAAYFGPSPDSLGGSSDSSINLLVVDNLSGQPTISLTKVVQRVAGTTFSGLTALDVDTSTGEFCFGDLLSGKLYRVKPL